MRASLNQLLNWFKFNLFVHGTGRRLLQKNEWFLTVISLSFGVGETNCSQGKVGADKKFEFWLMNSLYTVRDFILCGKLDQG